MSCGAVAEIAVGSFLADCDPSGLVTIAVKVPVFACFSCRLYPPPSSYAPNRLTIAVWFLRFSVRNFITVSLAVLVRFSGLLLSTNSNACAAGDFGFSTYLPSTIDALPSAIAFSLASSSLLPALMPKPTAALRSFVSCILCTDASRLSSMRLRASLKSCTFGAGFPVAASYSDIYPAGCSLDAYLRPILGDMLFVGRFASGVSNIAFRKPPATVLILTMPYSALCSST